MTVEVQDPFNTYTAAPGATVFPYGFKIVSPADLVATIDDIVIDLGIDFSLSGVGSNDGGDLTLFVPLTGGQQVLLKRQMTFNRETDYQQNGDFNSPVVNNDFDRLWLAMQQLGQDLKRSIKTVFTETTDQTIPLSPTARANKALVFDASGNVTASVDDYNDQAAAAAASAQAALDSQNASASSAGQANTDRLAAEQAAQAAVAAAASIDPADLVHKSGDETIQGVKTHTASPIVPDLADGDATTKAANAKFVQRAIALSGRKPGDLFDTASPRAPTGSLIVPVSASNISRSAYPTLFNAITIQTTGSTTNANNTLTAVGSTVGVEIGYPISGPGIQAGTTVTGKTANTITLSLNANATAAGVAIVIAPWGVGDGVSTFGMPYCPVGYTFVQASANLGTATVGEVIAHTHPAQIRGGSSPDQDGTGRGSLISVTGSTGGPANLAAGMRVTKCIQYL